MGGHLFALIAGDIALSVSALIAAIFVRFGSLHEIRGIVFNLWGTRILTFLVAILFTSLSIGLYVRVNVDEKKDIFIKVLFETLFSFYFLSLLYYMMPDLILGRGLLAISLCVFGLSQFFWHSYYKLKIDKSAFASRILIVGAGCLAEKIGNLISSINNVYLLTGYVNCSSETEGHVPPHLIKGNDCEILDIVRREKAHKIVVALAERSRDLPVNELIACKLDGIEVVDAHSFYERLTGKLLIEDITPGSLIFSSGFRMTQMQKTIKRMVDMTFSMVSFILTLPLLPLIALAIKIDSPGPVLFKQVRVGEKEKEFTLYKFRTMRNNAESDTGAVWAEEDDRRVTSVGRFLRKKRLDEIPQLYNVFKGEMSLIGPRPERPQFVGRLKELIPYYSERHFVKPGITGWAQVKYTYGASVEDAFEKLRYDLFYIKHISLFYDLMIMIETARVIFSGRGGR